MCALTTLGKAPLLFSPLHLLRCSWWKTSINLCVYMLSPFVLGYLNHQNHLNYYHLSSFVPLL